MRRQLAIVLLHLGLRVLTSLERGFRTTNRASARAKLIFSNLLVAEKSILLALGRHSSRIGGEAKFAPRTKLTYGYYVTSAPRPVPTTITIQNCDSRCGRLPCSREGKEKDRKIGKSWLHEISYVRRSRRSAGTREERREDKCRASEGGRGT